MYLSCLATTNKVVVVVALTREIFSNTLSGHVMFYLLYKYEWNIKPFHPNIVFWCERRDLLWSHSNGDIFTWEDNMLFSHVKIGSFRAKVPLVFPWCLYNKNSLTLDPCMLENTTLYFITVTRDQWYGWQHSLSFVYFWYQRTTDHIAMHMYIDYMY